MGWVGCPCDFGVSPRSNPSFFVFIRLGSLLGPGFGPGLDNYLSLEWPYVHRVDDLCLQACVCLLSHSVHHCPDQFADRHDVWHLLQDPGAIRYWWVIDKTFDPNLLTYARMEIWSCKTYPKHAKDLRRSNTTESLYNLDGADPEKILGTKSWEI